MPSVQPAAPPLDVDRLRRDFPILSSRAAGKPLVYLDSAASTQKPAPVIEAMNAFYREGYSNIHRGLYALSLEATEAYEEVRCKVQRFINARESREVVFVRGTTEAINLVAGTLARQRLEAGDDIAFKAYKPGDPGYPSLRVALLAAAEATGDPAAPVTPTPEAPPTDGGGGGDYRAGRRADHRHRRWAGL